MKKQYIIYFLCFGLSNALLAQKAKVAGVAGTKIWYKTQQSEAANLQLKNVTKPQDIVIQQASSKKSSINFNPSFYLEAAKTPINWSLDNLSFNQATIFTVYQAIGKEKILWHLTENDSTKIVLTTHRLSDLSNYEYLNFKNVQPGIPAINTYFHHSGKKGETSKQLKIGMLPTDQKLPIENFNGVFPEIIIFDRVLNPIERLKVESYLALKYSITIQSTDNQTYLNTKGDTIWFSKKPLFRIAGIGKEESTGLNQVKSTSSLDPNFLTIGVQDVNTRESKISEHAFLVWGDNGASLTFSSPNKMGAKLLNRQWQLLVTNQQNSLKTSLEINPKSLHIQPKKGETFWLVINPSLKDNFNTDHLIYHPISEKSTIEKIIFENIEWDMDNTGSDGFTLAIGPKVLTALSPEELAALQEETVITKNGIPQFNVYPNPSSDGYFQVKIRPNSIDKITLKIHNALGQEITQQDFGGSDYYFYENRILSKGVYMLTITEAGRNYNRKLVVE